MEDHPQLFTLRTHGGNAYSVQEFQLPVHGAPRGQRYVMEILRIDWYHALGNISDPIHIQWAFLSTVALHSTGAAASKATMQSDASDPRSFAMTGFSQNSAAGAFVEFPMRSDMSDGAGKGYILASERLFITRGATGADAPGLIVAKVLYRLRSVSQMQYIAIAQGQSINHPG